MKSILEQQYQFITQYEWLLAFNIIGFFQLKNRQEIREKVSQIDLASLIHRVQELSEVLLGNAWEKQTQEEKQKNQTEILQHKTQKQRLISEKKVYQVNAFSKYIRSRLSHELAIVDIGCGQGYLTSKLILQFPKVIGIDYDQNQIQGAIKRRKQNKQPEYRCSKFDKNAQIYANMHGVVSLHGCGQLFGEILEYFIKNQNCKAFAAVSCCYNRMDVPDDAEYFLKGMGKSIKYGRNFVMVACQCADRWIDTPKQTQDSIKRSITYRTILQKYLADKGIKIDKLGKLNISSIFTFQEYFQKACKKLQLKLQEIDLKPYIQLIEQYSEFIDKFWTVRAWIGLVAESLIVLDRAQYAKNRGIHVQVARVFDRRKSTRNICIFASKKE